jgi:hypothetical protein
MLKSKIISENGFVFSYIYNKRELRRQWIGDERNWGFPLALGKKSAGIA